MLLKIPIQFCCNFWRQDGFWELHFHFPFIKQTIYGNHPTTEKEIKFKTINMIKFYEDHIQFYN